MDIKLQIAEENARFELLKAECGRLSNSPERVAIRERIANNIGRPLNTDMTTIDPRWVAYTKKGEK
jgi:hypothetical protein